MVIRVFVGEMFAVYHPHPLPPHTHAHDLLPQDLCAGDDIGPVAVPAPFDAPAFRQELAEMAHRAKDDPSIIAGVSGLSTEGSKVAVDADGRSRRQMTLSPSRKADHGLARSGDKRLAAAPTVGDLIVEPPRKKAKKQDTQRELNFDLSTSQVERSSGGGGGGGGGDPPMDAELAKAIAASKADFEKEEARRREEEELARAIAASLADAGVEAGHPDGPQVDGGGGDDDDADGVILLTPPTQPSRVPTEVASPNDRLAERYAAAVADDGGLGAYPESESDGEESGDPVVGLDQVAPMDATGLSDTTSPVRRGSGAATAAAAATSPYEDDAVTVDSESSVHGSDEARARHTASRSKQTYQLRSVVSHLGTNALSGHYVAHVKVSDKVWTHHNDSSVREVSRSRALGTRRQRGGYLFFYVKTEAS